MKFSPTFALAAGMLCAQAPRIGQIDFYGLRKVPEERIRKALQLKEGNPLPSSKAEVEERLEKLTGVVLARLEAVCCEGGDAILFVGIEEKGAPHFALRTPPAENISLPKQMLETYRQLVEALQAAGRKGETAEDLTQGHSLMADAGGRELQERFGVYAKDNLKLLRDVLRNAADPEQRAVATTIIGYATDKRSVVDDLQYAIQDPDLDVRASAMRALGAIAVLARLKPELGIRIAPTWFIEMLHSIVLSDRNRAALALVDLTDDRDESVLEQIRRRALPALSEMARWKSLRYALPAYILLGRVAGLSEEQIHDSWSKGERQTALPVRSTRKAR